MPKALRARSKPPRKSARRALGEMRNQLGLYVGPKEIGALKKVNPNLENIIDWGWFGVIAKPLFLIIQWMNVGFVHNYGWSIVLVTVLINVAKERHRRCEQPPLGVQTAGFLDAFDG